jgi:hypothetical protein
MVPLTPDMLAILESLPRFENGDFIFSNSFGEQPSTITDKIKKKFDKMMLAELRTLRGDKKPARLEGFVTHDLRRVVRSKMSGLEVAHEVAEAVLGHTRPGIAGVYDRHSYANEKRQALEKWNAELHKIVEPEPTPAPTGNVVKLRAAR